MSTDRKESQIEFTAISVNDPIDVAGSKTGLQLSTNTPQSSCKDKCESLVENALEKITKILDDADLQNNSVDSQDLHKYKAKIPILFLYVAAFVASFAGLFSYSFTTDMSTKYLSPKDPKAPDSPNCKSDQISITGVYQIDTYGNWQGAEEFQSSRVAYEVRFQGFNGSYNDWKTISGEFEKDLNRVRETSLGMRNGHGDIAYSLLIPASYSFFKQMPSGSVQIYLRADASYLFNNNYKESAEGSMTGYQKNNTETPCWYSNDDPCSKFGKLSVVAPGEIDTSYDVEKGGILTFAIPTFKTNARSILPKFDDDNNDDDYDDDDDDDDGLYDKDLDDPNWDDRYPNPNAAQDEYAATLPASSFVTNLMHKFDWIQSMKEERGNGVNDLKLLYDMRSVATALAINNGLASINSLKSLGPEDISNMDAIDFVQEYIYGDNQQLGKYIDPYYADMDPIFCLSPTFIRDVINKLREYVLKEWGLSYMDGFDKAYTIYLKDLVKEIEENDERRICFVMSSLDYLDSTDIYNDIYDEATFVSFPTMNQFGSWSNTANVPDIKDECWFPAYGRYDGLHPSVGDPDTSYVKYMQDDGLHALNGIYFEGKKILISFLHIKSHTHQVVEMLSCTKLMHEMLSSYSTMEERFYSLYIENAATAGLNMLATAPARGFANANFRDHLYKKWISENGILDPNWNDPLNYKFGSSGYQLYGPMYDDTVQSNYGLRDISGERYKTLEEIKAREDLFLGGELYGDSLNDGSSYYQQVDFSVTNTNYALQNYKRAGPYYVCPSKAGHGLHFNTYDNGGNYSGNVLMRLFDESENNELGSGQNNLFYEETGPSCTNVYLHVGCYAYESCSGIVAIFVLRQPTMTPTTAPTLNSGHPRVGFYDFLSNNKNLVLDFAVNNDDNYGQTVVGQGNPQLSGCSDTYNNIMTNMFERFADSNQNSFSFTTSVVMSVGDQVMTDKRSRMATKKINNFIHEKALKNLAEPPVQLSQSYETCTKSVDSALVNSLGVAFSNAKLISDVVLLISLFSAVYILNNYVITSKAQKLISPENKGKLFRMTTSLAIQRMLKLDPKDYSNDKELKNIAHTLHVYDEMKDEEENFDHIRTTLSVLGVEMDPTPDPDGVKLSAENLTGGESKKVSNPPLLTESAATIEDKSRLAELTVALKEQEATIEKLVQRINDIETSKVPALRTLVKSLPELKVSSSSSSSTDDNIAASL